MGVSGLGLNIGGCSTFEDSDIVTLFGVCGWARGSGVVALGLASSTPSAASDSDTGSSGLRGLGVAATGFLRESGSVIVLAAARRYVPGGTHLRSARTASFSPQQAVDPGPFALRVWAHLRLAAPEAPYPQPGSPTPWQSDCLLTAD